MQRAKRRETIGLLLLTIGLAGLLIVYARSRDREKPKAPYAFPVRELAELDQSVQMRFAEMPTKDFGMSRIGRRHEMFVPVSVSERAAVADLQRQGWDVVFYVAGRNVLLNRTYPLHPNNIQGPIFMTQKGRLKWFQRDLMGNGLFRLSSLKLSKRHAPTCQLRHNSRLRRSAHCRCSTQVKEPIFKWGNGR
jgi:hypothetical protein